MSRRLTSEQPSVIIEHMFVDGGTTERIRFSEILAGLESFVASLCPDEYLGVDAQRLICDLSRAEKLCGSARILMGRRITSDLAERAGKTSPTEWMAAASGESPGRSRRDLETGRKLEKQPHLEHALRSGEISPTQASILADAGEADPEATAKLLEEAPAVSITVLKDRARRIIAAKTAEEDAIARDLRIRARRHLRFSVSDEGSLLLRGELPACEGAAVRNLLERRRDQIFRESPSKDESGREPAEAYLADALVSVCQQAAEAPSPQYATPRVPIAEIVLHVDVEALRRGELQQGESCVVAGVGPVPLATLEYLFGRSLATVVVKKGRDVVSITRAGRYFPPDLDKALRVRDQVCAVPGCGQRFGLERDHIVEVCRDGQTELENTVMLCRRHHLLKTMHRYTIQRSPDGSWRWVNLRPAADPGAADPAVTAEAPRVGARQEDPRPGAPPTSHQRCPQDPPVQQTLCCARRSVSIRLPVPRGAPPPAPAREPRRGPPPPRGECRPLPSARDGCRVR